MGPKSRNGSLARTRDEAPGNRMMLKLSAVRGKENRTQVEFFRKIFASQNHVNLLLLKIFVMFWTIMSCKITFSFGNKLTLQYCKITTVIFYSPNSKLVPKIKITNTQGKK